MNSQQIENLVGDPEFLLPYAVENPFDFYSFVSSNNKTAFPVEYISAAYINSEQVIIRDEGGHEMGVLLVVRNKQVEIHELSEYEFVALLADTDPDQLLVGQYTFRKNYVVIDNEFVIDYKLKYFNSAPLWGMFTHGSASTPIFVDPKKDFLDAFEANSFTAVPAREASLRGILQPFAFERFLKYYHLLELNFDYDLIDRIKKLNVETEAVKISKMLNEYQREDIDRLEYLFTTYCSNLPEIVRALNGVSSFKAFADGIFFHFGKQNNPLEQTQFDQLLLLPDHFSYDTTKKVLGGRINSLDTYKKFIGRLTMYWIYRLRNSIAHNKIGEYLMTQADEAFIKGFGEPLLMAVIRQVYK